MGRVTELVKERVNNSESLRRLSGELLIARQIEAAHRQSGTPAFKLEEKR